MAPTLLRCAITSAVVGFLAARSPSVLGVIGGVSVDEVLAARADSRYTEEQVVLARAVVRHDLCSAIGINRG